MYIPMPLFVLLTSLKNSSRKYQDLEVHLFLQFFVLKQQILMFTTKKNNNKFNTQQDGFSSSNWETNPSSPIHLLNSRNSNFFNDMIIIMSSEYNLHEGNIQLLYTIKSTGTFRFTIIIVLFNSNNSGFSLYFGVHVENPTSSAPSSFTIGST